MTGENGEEQTITLRIPIAGTGGVRILRNALGHSSAEVSLPGGCWIEMDGGKVDAGLYILRAEEEDVEVQEGGRVVEVRVPRSRRLRLCWDMAGRGTAHGRVARTGGAEVVVYCPPDALAAAIGPAGGASEAPPPPRSADGKGPERGGIRLRKPVLVDGEAYPSMAAAARATGLDARRLSTLASRHPGDEAFEMDGHEIRMAGGRGRKGE